MPTPPVGQTSPALGPNPEIQNIKALVPEYVDYNEEWLMNRLLSDEDFLKQTANKIMTSALESDPEFRNKYLSDDKAKNEENYLRDFNNFKANIRRNIIRHVTTGQDPKDTVIGRDIGIRTNSITPTQTPMVSTGDFTESAVAWLKKEEGLSLRDYKDANVRSIGYGHQIKPEERSSGIIRIGDRNINWVEGITKEDAELLLKQDLASHYSEAAKNLTKHGINVDNLTENQKIAIADLAYNIGPYAFNWDQIVKPFKEFQETGDGTKLKQAIRELAVTEQGSGGKILQGLVNRRAKSAELFFTGVGTTSQNGRPAGREAINAKPDLPLAEFRTIITQNADAYKDFGLTDSEGKLVFDEDTRGNLLFEAKLLASPELRNRLFSDRYANFQTEMAKSHNLTALASSDTEETARAYAVWSKFGSQGLTQYINYRQNYDSSKSINEQSQSFVSAFEFMNRRVGQYSPSEWIEEFVGGDESKYGKMEINPAVLPAAVTNPPPADYNKFSGNFYGVDSFNPISDQQAAVNFATKYSFDNDTDSLRELAKGGSGQYMDLVSRIEADEDPYDLYQVLSVAAREKSGNAKIIQRDGREMIMLEGFMNQPLKLRLAADALNFSNEYRDNVFFDKDNPDNLVIDINRQEGMRNAVQWSSDTWSAQNIYNVLKTMQDRGTVAKFDDQGNFLGMSEEISGGGVFWNGVLNTSLTALHYYYKFFPDLAANVITRASDDRELDALYERTFGEFNEAYNMFQQDYLTSDDAAVSKTIIYAGQFYNYIRAMNAYGGAIMGSAGNAAKFIGGVSQARAVASAASIAQGARTMSKWTMVGEALAAKGAANGLSGIRMLTGELAINLGERESETLFGSGALTFIGDKLNVSPETAEKLAEYERGYKRSDYATQMFTDFATSIVTSFIFDGVISGMRPSTWRGAGSVPRNWYENLEPISFLRESSAHMRNAADEYTKKTFAEGLGLEGTRLGAQAYNNPSASFYDDLIEKAAPHLSTLRSDIEDVLKYYDQKITGKPRTAEEIAKMSDRIYNNSISNLGKAIFDINEADPDAVLSVGTVGVGMAFIKASKSTVKDPSSFTPDQLMKNGKFTFEEAEAIRKGNKNLIIIKGEIDEAGNEMYAVKEFIDNDWAIDVGADLIRRATQFDKDKYIAAYVKAAGDKVDAAELEALTENLDNFMGTQIRKFTSDETVPSDNFTYIVKDNEDGTFDAVTIGFDEMIGKTIKIKPDADELYGIFERKLLRGDITPDDFQNARAKYFPKTETPLTKDVADLARKEPAEVVEEKVKETKKKKGKEDIKKAESTAKTASTTTGMPKSDLVGRVFVSKKGVKYTVTEVTDKGTVRYKTDAGDSGEFNKFIWDKKVEKGEIVWADAKPKAEEPVVETPVVKSEEPTKAKAKTEPVKPEAPKTAKKEEITAIATKIKNGEALNDAEAEFYIKNGDAIDKAVKEMPFPKKWGTREEPRIEGFASSFINAVKKVTGDALSMKNLREQMINFGRNLGIDSIASLRYRFGKKLLYGDNLEEIKDYDFAKASDAGIPKGTIVRLKNGAGHEFFYRANKKTKIPPTRWLMFGEMIGKNPDWDQLNVNQTIDSTGAPQLYTYDKKVKGYRASKGTNGFLLNIQNADATVRRADVDENYILDNNIDAFKFEQDGVTYYELVSPSTQMVSPKEAFKSATQEVDGVELKLSDDPKAPKASRGRTLAELRKNSKKVELDRTLDELSTVESKIDPKTGRRKDDILSSYAVLAPAGAVMSGAVGFDEDGEMTVWGKLAMATGILGFGGVFLRSLKPKFKIRAAYDMAPPKIKNTFDNFDFDKFSEDGKHGIKDHRGYIEEPITQDEQAMLNWFTKQGVPKDDFVALKELTFEYVNSFEYEDLVNAGKAAQIGKQTLKNLEFEAKVNVYTDALYGYGPVKLNTYSSNVVSKDLVVPTEAATSNILTISVDNLEGVSANYKHTFSKWTDGKHEKVETPAWARYQIKDTDVNGAKKKVLYIDEIQIQNELEKGSVGTFGELRIDLYSMITDQLFSLAKKEGVESVYVTSGQLQELRYHSAVTPRNSTNILDISEAERIKLNTFGEILYNFKKAKLNEDYYNTDQLINRLTKLLNKEEFNEAVYDLNNYKKELETFNDNFVKSEDYKKAKNNLIKIEEIILKQIVDEDLKRMLINSFDEFINESQNLFSFGNIKHPLKEFRNILNVKLNNPKYGKTLKDIDDLFDPMHLLSAKQGDYFYEELKIKTLNNLRKLYLDKINKTTKSNFTDIEAASSFIYKGRTKEGYLLTKEQATELLNNQRDFFELLDKFKKSEESLYFYDKEDMLAYAEYASGKKKNTDQAAGLYQFYNEQLPNIIKKRYGWNTKKAVEGPPGFASRTFEQAFHEIEINGFSGLDEAYGKTTKRLIFEKESGLVAGGRGLPPKAGGTEFASFPKAGGFAFAGGLAGAIADEYEGDNSNTWAFLGTGAGFLLGSSAVRGAIATSFGKIRPHSINIRRAGKGMADHVDASVSKEIEIEAAMKPLEDLRKEGFVGSKEDAPAYNDLLERFKTHITDPARQLSEDSASLIDQASHSRHIRSSFSFMTGLSATARVLRDILFQHPQEGNKLLARFKADIIKNLGGNKTITDVEKSLNEVTTGIRQNQGMKASIFQSEEQAAYQEWTSAMWRIINSGGKLEGGKLVWDTKVKNVSDQYNKKQIGEYYQKLDAELLSNPDFIAYRDGIQKTFKEVKQEWLGLVNNQIRSELDLWVSTVFDTKINTEAKMRQIMERWLTVPEYQKMTFNAFGKTLTRESEIAAFNKVKKMDDATTNKLFDLARTRRTFTEVGDNYLPQLVDRKKLDALHAQAMEKAMKENPGITREQAKEKADEIMLRQFSEANEKEIKRLKFFDEATQEMEDKIYKSEADAYAELERIYDQLPDDMRQEWAAINVRRFIKETEVTSVIGKSTKRIKNYTIEIPDDFYERYKHIWQAVEKSEISAQFEAFKAGSFVKNSNFLERPRHYNIPQEWAETDIEQILYRYSVDAGPRMHMLRNGIYNVQDLKRNFLNKIESELIEQGMTKDQYQTRLNRVESDYNMQTGIMADISNVADPSKRAEAMKNRSRLERFGKTIRNITFAPIGYMISYLDAFQPFGMGAMLSSYDSISKTWTKFALNKQALTNYEELSKNMGLSMRTLEAYRAGNNVDDSALYVYGDSNKTAAFAERMADKGSELVANASITRSLVWAANKIPGVKFDVDNWGMARLLTDNFMGVNSVSTTINWAAGIAEAQKLASMYKTLKEVDAAGNPVTLRVENMGLNEVINKMKSIGLRESRIDNFVKRQDEFAKMVDALGGKEKFDYKMADEMPDLYNDITDIATTMTDRYHGKNKMLRPSSWNSQAGRILSQFAVYPFNFGLQVTQNSILNSKSVFNGLKVFNDKVAAGVYGDNIKQIGRVEGARLMNYFATKNWDKLRALGFTDEAIADFPVSAYTNVLKIMGAVSVAAASFITRDAINDLMMFPLNEATNQEQWQRLKNRKLVNPYAPEEAQITWAELVDGSGMTYNEFFTATRGMMDYAADTGVFGVWGNIVGNQFAERDGITAYIAPVSKISRAVQSFNRVANSEFDAFPETIQDEIATNIFEYAPFAGSFKRSLAQGYSSMTNQADYRGIRIRNAETNEMFPMSDFNFIP